MVLLLSRNGPPRRNNINTLDSLPVQAIPRRVLICALCSQPMTLCFVNNYNCNYNQLQLQHQFVCLSCTHAHAHWIQTARFNTGHLYGQHAHRRQNRPHQFGDRRPPTSEILQHPHLDWMRRQPNANSNTNANTGAFWINSNLNR